MGWKIGTSCPAFLGPFGLGIQIGRSINLGGSTGTITLKSDKLKGNGKGFKATYTFEGQQRAIPLCNYVLFQSIWLVIMFVLLYQIHIMKHLPFSNSIMSACLHM